MRPITVTVGPLATASATKVAAAQRNYGAGGALALNGAATSLTATSVCASQSPAAAAFTINGTQTVNGVAYLRNQYIYIVNGGDSHTRTVTVVGTSGLKNIVVTEVITLSNAQVVGSANSYNTILSITPSGAVTGTVTVGSYSGAILDTPRRVLFTTGADESANTAIVTGTGWSGNAQTETVALTNTSTSNTLLDYLTVSKITITAAAAGNISVGTNTVASSAWVRLDPWAPGPLTAQFNVTGTVNFDVQASNDDTDAPNAVLPSAVVWDTALTGVTGATASNQISMSASPLWIRILLNSGTGSVSGTVIQAGVTPI